MRLHPHALELKGSHKDKVEALLAAPKKLAFARARLNSVDDAMKSVKQKPGNHIANLEDTIGGGTFARSYHNELLIDAKAILNALSYICLNPFAANKGYEAFQASTQMVSNNEQDDYSEYYYETSQTVAKKQVSDSTFIEYKQNTKKLIVSSASDNILLPEDNQYSSLWPLIQTIIHSFLGTQNKDQAAIFEQLSIYADTDKAMQKIINLLMYIDHMSRQERKSKRSDLPKHKLEENIPHLILRVKHYCLQALVSTGRGFQNLNPLAQNYCMQLIKQS